MKNYYEILEVDVKASKEMIERAFKLLAKRYHPDTQPQERKAWAEEKFKEINEAYEILSDLEKKKEYDIELDYAKNSELETLYLQKAELERQVVELRMQLQEQQTRINERIREPINDYTNPNLYQREYVHTVQQEPEQVYYYEKPHHIRNRLKDFISIIIAISIIIFIGYLLWKIPFTQTILVDFYENNPPIKNIADFFIHFFK